MKIGIDLCDLNPDYGGGVNSFAIGLARGLVASRGADETVVILTGRRNDAFLRAEFPQTGVSFLNIATSRIGARLDILLVDLSWVLGCFQLRHWFDRMFRAGAMRRVDAAVDALVAPMTLMKFHALRAPTILSIHDIQQEYHPDFFTPLELRRRWAPYRLSCWRAEAVQASSQYIKDCITEKYAFVDAAKVFVIPEGVDLEKFSPGAPQEMPPTLADVRPGTFVFYPAQFWPHKNHMLLVEALALYRARTGQELPCVLTGKDYGHWPAVRAGLQKHDLQQVRYLGKVAMEQLVWLYNHCVAVLALGLHESSSLPLREGAAFGKPLICVDIPPNREAGEHLRMHLVDRTDPSVLADVFHALSEDRGDLVAIARENVVLARRFDWTTLTSEYRRILGRLVQLGKRS